jgi:alginate O-acetyltransferase complex protein AlgI
MQFPTFTFSCFFLAFLLVWWMLPTVAPRLRAVALTAGSLVFYAWADPRFVPILIGVAVVTWGGSQWLARTSGTWKTLAGVTLSIALIAHLVFWKYTDWMVGGWNSLHPGSEVALPGWVYPVGLSFFTFHALSLLAGVWRGTSPAPTPVQAFAHVSFFPALLAGPVLRPEAIIPRLGEGFVWAGIPVSEAIARIGIGMTFKWVLAAHIATFADPVFQGMANHPWEVWMGVHAYALQIFFDFAGYSQMALGLALLLGFRLPENFTQPYLATSVTDFWRRWHRSLSFFFRDNLYIGVFGGNRHGMKIATLAAIGTMVISGLWHGANVTFLIWGAWHAAALTLERFLPGRNRWPAFIGWLVTLETVVWGWVFFRAEDVPQATDLLAQAFSIHAPDWAGFMDAAVSLPAVLWVGVMVAVIAFERHIIETAIRLPMVLDGVDAGFQRRAFVFSCILCVWAWGLMALGPVGVPPFIYNGF